jgi:plastocyanin
MTLSIRSAVPRRAIWLALTLSMLAGWPAWAADTELLLVIKNHRFEPAELRVKAGEKIRLSVHNQDATPEEFESKSLGREKIVPAGKKVLVLIGPLKPGTYGFVGEQHEDTAQGRLVAE